MDTTTHEASDASLLQVLSALTTPVPFGKYRDWPLGMLLRDASYRKWVLGNASLMAMYQDFHALLLIHTATPMPGIAQWMYDALLTAWWKAEDAENSRIAIIRQYDALRTQRPAGIPPWLEQELTRCLASIHPDKWHDHPAATEATKQIVGIRDRVRQSDKNH